MSEIREGISSEVSSQIISFPLFPYLPISPSPHTCATSPNLQDSAIALRSLTQRKYLESIDLSEK